MATGQGALRWWTTRGSSETQPTWHLRYGNSGQTLCDVTIATGSWFRELREGPPARRCPACSDVVRHQLGIDTK